MRTGHRLVLPALLGVLAASCGTSEKSGTEPSNHSEFYLVNSSSHSLVSVVQYYDRSPDSSSVLAPGSEWRIVHLSGDYLNFPLPEESLACLSVFSEQGGLLVYQQYPIANDCWTERGGARWRDYRLELTSDSLHLEGLNDSCGN